MAGPTEIRELLLRRGDLSTFIVHLTRDTDDRHTAKSNLKRILKHRVLEARSAFGPAKNLRKSADRATQKCVSFSETPLEHIKCLTCDVPGRRIKLSSYGLGFTKMSARRRGVNPVWYVDITPGHEWLTKPIDAIIEAEVKDRSFRDSNFAMLSPFIEHMGSGQGKNGQFYQKEFWWEREWRHRGDFKFFYSEVAFGFAPEEDVEELQDFVNLHTRRKIRFLDPNWSAEKMIAHLCGCVGNLSPFDS